MSDHYQIVVVTDVPATEALPVSKILVKWLQDREMIRKESLRSVDELLHHAEAYAHLLPPEALESLRKTKESVPRGDAYIPGPGARASLDRPNADRWWPSEGGGNSAAFGLEVRRGTMLHADVNVPTTAVCPACRKSMPNLNWFEPPLDQASEQWLARGESPLSCANCGKESDLSAWHFEPPAACGALALRFGNWPKLSNRFLEDLAGVAKSRVVLVEELI